MGSPYVGEIRMFAGNFAPAGWMFCQGQLLPISENETLFQLIGTTYGGDGEQTFALPNLSSRVPLHMGQGAGLSNYVIGQSGGTETVTVTALQMPLHTHAVGATNSNGSATSPNGALFARNPSSPDTYSNDISGGIVPISPNAVSPSGGSQPHENMQPYLAINFIISLFGIFPSQS